MKLNSQTVRKMFTLSRIGVGDDKLEPLVIELSNILDWIDELSKVNTDNVEPLYNVTDRNLIPREDKKSADIATKQVTANAPLTKDGFFIVPRVVKKNK